MNRRVWWNFIGVASFSQGQRFVIAVPVVLSGTPSPEPFLKCILELAVWHQNGSLTNPINSLERQNAGPSADKTKKSRRGENPGGEPEPKGVESAHDGIAALSVLTLGGGDRQAHLFAQSATYESP